jgi:ribosomal protein S18 acetylase RimI-like enzyme
MSTSGATAWDAQRLPFRARSMFDRAVDTERTYFELGAEIERLHGAELAWMPGLTASPAAAVIHRVRPATCAANGPRWIAEAEEALLTVGAGLARIYVDMRGSALDPHLLRAGYVAREELVFVHSLPVRPPMVSLRQVTTDADWRRKLRFHESVEGPPDGHHTAAAQWVELERRKCRHGMECYLAEIDGETVGAVGHVAGDGLLRIKNLVVHPDHRRRSIGCAMLSQVAALGREIGIVEQCLLAVRSEVGELLYRAVGMRVAGSLVEWSKPIGGTRS